MQEGSAPMQESHEPAATGHRTSVERRSDRELVVTRLFDGPPRLLFKAWTTPDLLKRWWAPQSTGATLTGCAVDARPGGSYRFEFAQPSGDTVAFFGRYLEVDPPHRLVWTNEESDGGQISTLTFTAEGDRTRMVLHELYPSKQALDQAFDGMEYGMPEQYDQLDALLATLPHDPTA